MANKIETKITKLFGIKYPVIQAGMVWVSGWKLASAVSNCGGLGMLGAGSMKPDLLAEHILKCKNATPSPFAVNVPLLRKDAEDLINVSIENGVKIIFTSAGNPKTFIDKLKSNNIISVHVVPSIKFGLKVQQAGYDAVVGEGVEAGGHNGSDEITTLCLIPQLVDALDIPVIAAGGIADGRTFAAALTLGAEAVQIGTLFAASIESSAHDTYKNLIVNAKDNDTILAFKKLSLVRMLKNNFALKVSQAELSNNFNIQKQIELLGTKRERAGIFEGNLDEGMMEAGQSSGLVKSILPVNEIFKNLLEGYYISLQRLNSIYGLK